MDDLPDPRRTWRAWSSMLPPEVEATPTARLMHDWRRRRARPSGFPSSGSSPRARGELADIDYEFLYDRERHLLAIGYNVGDHRLDASFYDLLASEARLASFVAIAQGKLPQEHWFSLGRLAHHVGRAAGAAVVERLDVRVPDAAAGHADVRPHAARRDLPRRRRPADRVRPRARVPWGVSESGYNKTDAQLNYQYHAFGVPGLGFKRGLADDVVIAPYASAMGLMVDPAVRMRQPSPPRARRTARARTGSTRPSTTRLARLPRGQDERHRPLVHGAPPGDGVPVARVPAARPADAAAVRRPTRRSGRPTCCCRSASPRRRRSTRTRRKSSAARGTPCRGRGQLPRLHHAEHARAGSAPALQRPVPRRRHGGRRRVQPLARSGRHPLARGPDARLLGHVLLPPRCRDRRVLVRRHTSRRSSGATSYEAIYSQGRAEFRRRDGDIETHVEISVSPEDDIELRRVSITNRGRERDDDRADELRRGRARAAGGGRGAPGVQQPVRADAARPRAAGDPLHAPPALGRRAPAVDDAPDDRPRHRQSARPPTRPAARSSSAAAGRSPTRRRCTATR